MSGPGSGALGGVVLCGGRSSRMGRDKARIPVNGRPMALHVADLVARVADPVFLAPGRPGRLGPVPYPEVEDELAGAGPLGAVAAALAANPHPLLAVVGGDMPFASPTVLGLLASLGEGADAVVPVTASGLEPLHAVYAASALPVVRHALRARSFGLQDLLGRLSVRRVDESEWRRADPEGRFAVNLNEVTDLTALR